MFLRTLLLTVAIGASLAIAGVAAAPAKDGIKVAITLPAIPPLTQTPMLLACTVVTDGGQGRYECHNTGGPNPFPPKDTKSIVSTSPGGKDTVTAYPDGRVTEIGTFKFPKGCSSLSCAL